MAAATRRWRRGQREAALPGAVGAADDHVRIRLVRHAVSADNQPMSKVDATMQPAHSGLPADARACYKAMQSRDARFDGRFFVAVRTTRIYCRPVCRVRLPRAENCQFYLSAAAAERDGFRPCMRCRPELAPGWAAIDNTSQLARAAAHLIDTGLGEGVQLRSVAERVGVTDRHLRRLFEAHFGVSPVDYLQTQRLLLAKRLLTDTGLPVPIVAQAAGFGSVRRLNASMRERYRLTPTELRRKGANASRSPARDAAGALSFDLPLREPYDWPMLHGFLASRQIDGLEVSGTHDYRRVITLRGSPDRLTGWIAASVSPGSAMLRLSVSAELATGLSQVLPLARAVFDLDTDPAAVAEALGELATPNPGLRLPGAISGFEIAVRAVLGQQITVRAARTLASRFVASFGAVCRFDAQPALTRAFPEPAAIAAASAEQIGKLGITRRRVATIQALASEIDAGRLVLHPGAPVPATLEALNALPGIGDWTAQYIAMRALRWPDAFPAADYGVMKVLQVTTAAQARHAAQHWRPWRAYAVMHLWAALARESAT